MATMESKPILRIFKMAVVNLVANRPILPTYVQDLPAERRPSPPPTPLQEVIVISSSPTEFSPTKPFAFRPDKSPMYSVV